MGNFHKESFLFFPLGLSASEAGWLFHLQNYNAVLFWYHQHYLSWIFWLYHWKKVYECCCSNWEFICPSSIFMVVFIYLSFHYPMCQDIQSFLFRWKSFYVHFDMSWDRWCFQNVCQRQHLEMEIALLIIFLIILNNI